jgi:hypothetical protein
VIVLVKPAASGFKTLLHTAARQQTNFSAFLFKHDTFFFCAMNTREALDSIYLCPCIGPVPTTATKVPSSPARALLLGASGPAAIMASSSRRVFIG